MEEEHNKQRGIDGKIPQQIIKQPEAKPKQSVEMVRTTRNLLSQMKVAYKHTEPIQLSLFDELPTMVRERVEKKKMDKSTLYIGADLDGAGWRLVEVLQKMLHQHSNTTDQTRPDYYMGDYKPKGEDDKTLKPIKFTEDLTAVRPTFETSVNEIAAQYTCTDNPSGGIIKSVGDKLLDIAQRNYLFVYTEYYTEEYTDKNGKKKQHQKSKEIKTLMPLYSIDEVTENTDGKETARRLIIKLNPMFQRQIDTRHNDKPLDFLERVLKASKSIWKRQLPDALLPFLNTLIDAQHYEETKTKNGKQIVPARTYHVKQTELYTTIAPTEMSIRNKRAAEKKLDGFIKVATDIGLLQKHWTDTSKKDGEIVHYFQVREQWKN